MTEKEYSKKWPMDKIPDAVRKAAVAWGDHLFIRDKVKLAQDMLDATQEYREQIARKRAIDFIEWITRAGYFQDDDGSWHYKEFDMFICVAMSTDELYGLFMKNGA